jgi:hypothetical protein
MREFKAYMQPVFDTAIRRAAQELFEAAPVKREVRGAVFMLDNPESVVLREVDIRFADGGRFRLAVSDAAVRPPFEWLMEITSEIGESDYIKHYLVREHDIVLAQRKVLTPLDDREAEVLLADLRTARQAL